MPSYAEVTKPQLAPDQLQPSIPTQSSLAKPRQQQPVWLSDAILASRVQFLMGMLAPCLAALPQVIVLPSLWPCRLASPSNCAVPVLHWHRCVTEASRHKHGQADSVHVLERPSCLGTD